MWEISVYGVLSALKPPNVSVGTDRGNVVSPNTQLNLIANVSDPDSGTIEQVKFFVNGDSIGTINSSPFQFPWTATGTDSAVVKIIVTDNDGLSVQSDPYTIYIDDGSMTHFEAEHASYTGQVSIVNFPGASGGAYLDMKDAWILTFNNIGIPAAGNYLLTIGYQLTYQSPKTQFILINGDTLTALEFTSTSTSLWLKRGLIVPLLEGSNTVAIYGFWNWMSIDYIAIPDATVLYVEKPAGIPTSYSLSQNYPNPFNPETFIRYCIPRQSQVTLKVYEALGREITTLINEEKSVGYYEVKFSLAEFASGVYFYQLKAGNFIQTKKMILMK